MLKTKTNKNMNTLEERMLKAQQTRTIVGNYSGNIIIGNNISIGGAVNMLDFLIKQIEILNKEKLYNIIEKLVSNDKSKL
jgi:hypothetical protein